MPTRPVTPAVANDSRYLTADEKAALAAFAGAVPARLRAAAAIERAEPGAFDAALAGLARTRPEWADGRAWPAGLGAERAAVRYAVHAALFADDGLFFEKGLDWVQAVRRAAEVDPGTAKEAGEQLREGFKMALPADAFAVLDPYLRLLAEPPAAAPDPAPPAAGLPHLTFRRLSRALGPNYPDRAAADRLAEWAKSAPDRVACSDACEEAEGRIVRSVIDALKADYPDYPRYQPTAWAKGYRDVQLVLRHAVNAMVRDDLGGYEQGFLAWLRTILQAFIFHSPKFVWDTYVLLRAGCRRELPAAAFGLLEPFLDKTLEVLSDIPAEYIDGPRPAASQPDGPTLADEADASDARAPEVARL